MPDQVMFACLCPQECSPMQCHTTRRFIEFRILVSVLDSPGHFNFRMSRKLIRRSRNLTKKRVFPSASQYIHSFYGDQMFITFFTTARHLYLFWSIKSHFNVHLHRGFASGPFPSSLPNQNTVHFSYVLQFDCARFQYSDCLWRSGRNFITFKIGNLTYFGFVIFYEGLCNSCSRNKASSFMRP